MNKNDTEILLIFVAALRLLFVGCSVKSSHSLLWWSFYSVVRIIRVASSGNAP